MYALRFAKGAIMDLESIKPHTRGEIVDAIEDNLQAQPLTPTRNRNELVGLVPPWDQARPVWELRVNEYRVFYDVDTEKHAVLIRAIRHKGRKTTEEIL